ncbi:pentapeptide repeat-containing protein [Streptomyces mauvecolor]
MGVGTQLARANLAQTQMKHVNLHEAKLPGASIIGAQLMRRI